MKRNDKNVVALSVFIEVYELTICFDYSIRQMNLDKEV
jgi:hypothetical protein